MITITFNFIRVQTSPYIVPKNTYDQKVLKCYRKDSVGLLKYLTLKQNCIVLLISWFQDKDKQISLENDVGQSCSWFIDEPAS